MPEYQDNLYIKHDVLEACKLDSAMLLEKFKKTDPCKRTQINYLDVTLDEFGILKFRT